MISALFFVWFSVAFLWTFNALRKPAPPGEGLAPLWLPGMVVSELAAVFLLTRALAAAIFLYLGAAELAIGKAGFVLFVVSEIGLVVIIARAIRASQDLNHRASLSDMLEVWDRTPPDEEIVADVPYATDLTLNVHRRPGISNAPALVYLHPGSWMRGKPGRQARPLVHGLVAAGWVVLDVRYPLSPAATFPDHVVGVKRAIAWAKEEGSGFGVDPTRVVISGGSAGAHLAAIAALTPHRLDLQPGFEESDVSVIGCLPFYGIFDLFNRNNTRYDWPFVAKYVMKAKPQEATDLYQLGSPLDLVYPGAPPFHIVHGEFDSVVLPAESTHLFDALNDLGNAVRLTVVGAAQHGFDGLSGLRAKAIGAACADWLNDIASHPGR